MYKKMNKKEKKLSKKYIKTAEKDQKIIKNRIVQRLL